MAGYAAWERVHMTLAPTFATTQSDDAVASVSSAYRAL
jgi:hypothetical protein